MLKKIVILILLSACIVGLAFSCRETNDSYDSFERSFDKKGNYIGFSDLPSNYTFEKAKNDGCFVQRDLNTFANENLWDNFVKASSQREDSSIRIVRFFTEDDSVYFTDLHYMNGYYYIFCPSLKNQKKKGFLYLLTLGGKDDNPPKNSCYIVLSNDKTLTYETVKKDLDSIILHGRKHDKNVPKYEIVMLK